jgi:hypothetical protein
VNRVVTRSKGVGARFLGLALVLAVRAASAAETAPDSPPPRNTVLSLEGGGLLFGSLAQVEVEQAVKRWGAFYVAPGVLIGAMPASSSPTVIDGMWGFGFSLGFRFYLMGTAPKGLYLAPEATVGFTHRSAVPQEAAGFLLSGGAEVGYNFAVTELWRLSVGAGAAWRHDQLIVGASRQTTEGFVPLARLAVGVAL